MLPDPAVPSFPSFPSFPSNERSERDMATIRCDIVSAEQEIFHGEAEMIVATGEMGELGIAPRHAPLITRLKPGTGVVTQPGGKTLDLAHSGGITEVQPQLVTIRADTSVSAQAVDEAARRAPPA